MESPKVKAGQPDQKKEGTPAAEYKMVPITEMPKRTFFRGSKYYHLIEDFLKNPPVTGISKIEAPKDIEGNYLASQINKQRKSHKLENKVKVSCVAGTVYLELVKPAPTKP